MSIIYFLVALIATTLGSLVGLGGGVIIKPVLDTLGHYDLSTISLLSSMTVFSMAIVSTYRQIRKGFKIELRLYVLSLGGILGGILGKALFSFFISLMPGSQAQGIQAIILGLLLLIVLFKAKLPQWNIQNLFFTLIIGLSLGTIASFLCIGGGPINVAVMIIFLGMGIKEAAVCSVFIILWSQFSKLAVIYFNTGFSGYDLSMLAFMIPAAIFGGLLGSRLNRFLPNHAINQVFNIMLIILIGLNIYNAIVFLT